MKEVDVVHAGEHVCSGVFETRQFVLARDSEKLPGTLSSFLAIAWLLTFLPCSAACRTALHVHIVLLEWKTPLLGRLHVSF